ncbi:MAG: BrnT family toxin [Rhodobacter sp.]|nr:BrnT family toxin [Rhodobacter sp.]
MFEWDEAKRLATLEKHKLDFRKAIEVFASDHLITSGKSELEERLVAVGILNGKAISVIFTYRAENIRIITARIARRDEREKLHAYLAGTGEEA